MATPSISSSISTPFENVIQSVSYRRFLLHAPLYPATRLAAATPPTAGPPNGVSSFDTHIIMILSVLLCALIFSLGLNSIVRCIFRSSNFGLSRPSQNPSARLANTEIKKNVLKTFPVVCFSEGSNLPGLDSECVICLSEFKNGERLKVLPKCNHGFHAQCIDKWLNMHFTCPTCRHCLIETCQKIVGCDQNPSTTILPPPPPLETIIAIVPLQPEGLMINYR